MYLISHPPSWCRDRRRRHRAPGLVRVSQTPLRRRRVRARAGTNTRHGIRVRLSPDPTRSQPQGPADSYPSRYPSRLGSESDTVSRSETDSESSQPARASSVSALNGLSRFCYSMGSAALRAIATRRRLFGRHRMRPSAPPRAAVRRGFDPLGRPQACLGWPYGGITKKKSLRVRPGKRERVKKEEKRQRERAWGVRERG
jgi:hypothetical protein